MCGREPNKVQWWSVLAVSTLSRYVLFGIGLTKRGPSDSLMLTSYYRNCRLVLGYF